MLIASHQNLEARTWYGRKSVDTVSNDLDVNNDSGGTLTTLILRPTSTWNWTSSSNDWSNASLAILSGTGYTHGDINLVDITSDSSAQRIIASKSRGDWNATGTADMAIVANGDDTLQMRGRGYDGNDFEEMALIAMEVDGTPGLNDMPGRITWHTTADGANSTTERMRLKNDGQLIIGSTTGENSSILEITSTLKGFLLPRVTTTQRDAIVSADDGLFVYNTTTTSLNFFAGTGWIAVPK